MKASPYYFDFFILMCLILISGSCIRAPQFDVRLSESEITVNENTGSVDVEFVLPDGSRRQDVEVAFRINGTAKEGIDYTTIDARFIISPGGSESISFNIDLLNNITQDGSKTIIVSIILVIQNGNTIYQGAEGQSLTILVTDDDCSIYIAGTWEYTARYQMFAHGDTIQVGQDSKELEDGVDPIFSGLISIEDPGANRKYFISDMLVGMFMELDIETPCPLFDACGILSGPNDGSIVLLGELPAYLTGTIENDSTIFLDFEYSDVAKTGGGGGHAVLVRK